MKTLLGSDRYYDLSKEGQANSLMIFREVRLKTKYTKCADPKALPSYETGLITSRKSSSPAVPDAILSIHGIKITIL